MSRKQMTLFNGSYTIIVPAVENGSWSGRGNKGTRDPVRRLLE